MVDKMSMPLKYTPFSSKTAASSSLISSSTEQASTSSSTSGGTGPEQNERPINKQQQIIPNTEREEFDKKNQRMGVVSSNGRNGRDNSDGETMENVTTENDQQYGRVESITRETLKRVAKYTPLRLSDYERILLGVVEGALDHSEFTSNVDVSSSMHFVRETWDKEERVHREVLEFCRVLLGLSAANEFKSRGKETLGENLRDREEFFQHCLEVGRRFKIMNPDKLRDSYGKLLYLLMDAQRIRSKLNMKLMRPVETVSDLLQRTDGESLLDDEAIVVACGEITVPSAELVRQKAMAKQYLVDKYADRLEGAENVHRVISSIEDALSFLRSNRDPVDQLIGYLKKHFHPQKEPRDRDISLSLQGRNTKPRHILSHDHQTQFTFVYQSLLLWREVMNEFFHLWLGAEEDLLNPRNGYALTNTGQGMQRCQQAPATGSNMRRILSSVQGKTGSSWVGLQVVHLGDREVPNALTFIDKYTQVPRIIGPIVRCIQAIEGELSNNPAIRKYIDETFKSPDHLIKLILADLFRGGFDGGGDLGGSCIDGRLTSLWNWSSLIEKKPWYGVFLLSGFYGFDGKF